MITLLLLPAFVAGAIHIEIVPATETTNVSVQWSGSENWPITMTDQKAFQLGIYAIPNKLHRVAYDPLVFDHFQPGSSFKFTHLTVKLVPVKATIKRHTKRSVIVTVKEFNNNSSFPATFKGGIKEDVLETVSTTWSTSEQLSVGITVDLKFGSGSLSQTTSWGKDLQKSTSRTISTNSDVEMLVQPGKKAKAILTAIRAVLEVEVIYEATLEGDIYYQFTSFPIPMEAKCCDVHKYLNRMGLPNSVRSTEVISLDYYFGAKMDVTEGDYKAPFELL